MNGGVSYGLMTDWRYDEETKKQLGGGGKYVVAGKENMREKIKGEGEVRVMCHTCV